MNGFNGRKSYILNLARDAKEVCSRDERSPILFVRSFQDEDIEVSNERYWGHAFLGIKDEKIRLEEILAETLFSYGPLVALADPRHNVKPLGAVRENVASESWKEDFKTYSEEAAWIIMLVRSTPSLKWELDQLIPRGLLAKSILVFPPSYHELEDPQSLLVNSLPELAAVLGITSSVDERYLLDGTLVMSWSNNEHTMIIRQDGGGEARGYADAARLAITTKAI
jgi:hypothetical protein